MNMLWLTWPQKKTCNQILCSWIMMLKTQLWKKTRLLIRNLLKLKTCPKNRVLLWHFWKKITTR
jgi:hypothetical protein